jgi:hypothetical protein
MYIKMYILLSFYFNAVTKNYWFKNVVLSLTDLNKGNWEAIELAQEYAVHLVCCRLLEITVSVLNYVSIRFNCKLPIVYLFDKKSIFDKNSRGEKECKLDWILSKTLLPSFLIFLILAKRVMAKGHTLAIWLGDLNRQTREGTSTSTRLSSEGYGKRSFSFSRFYKR